MTADGSDRSFGAPRFDVVLRGYDRRQVDEHLSRLQRVLARMRGDLDAARSQSGPPGPPLGPVLPPGGRPRPTPRPRPDGPDREGADRHVPDVVGTFTDRMQTILQAAEDEAAEIRTKARSAARAEEERLASARATARADEEMARVTLTNLLRQRDAVLADLTRVRGQLEALLSGPTARIPVPVQDKATAAAARRDAGAGHPLPGTPPSPQAAPAAAPAVVPAGGTRPGAAPDVEPPPGSTSAAESTTLVAAPGSPRPPATDAPAAAEHPAGAHLPGVRGAGSPAERAGAGSPSEQTMVMAPAETPKTAADDDSDPPDGDDDDDQGADAPTGAPGVHDTVEVGSAAPEAGAPGDPESPRSERAPVSNSR